MRNGEERVMMKNIAQKIRKTIRRQYGEPQKRGHRRKIYMTTAIPNNIKKRMELRLGTEWLDKLSHDYLTLEKVEGDVMHLSNEAGAMVVTNYGNPTISCEGYNNTNNPDLRAPLLTSDDAYFDDEGRLVVLGEKIVGSLRFSEIVAFGATSLFLLSVDGQLYNYDLLRDHFDNVGHGGKIVKVEKLKADIEDINSSLSLLKLTVELKDSITKEEKTEEVKFTMSDVAMVALYEDGEYNFDCVRVNDHQLNSLIAIEDFRTEDGEDNIFKLIFKGVRDGEGETLDSGYHIPTAGEGELITVVTFRHGDERIRCNSFTQKSDMDIVRSIKRENTCEVMLIGKKGSLFCRAGHAARTIYIDNLDEKLSGYDYMLSTEVDYNITSFKFANAEREVVELRCVRTEDRGYINELVEC
jgi:hypothetical protein